MRVSAQRVLREQSGGAQAAPPHCTSEEDTMKINPKLVIKLVKLAVQVAEVIINKK
ncbi:hypothetical protein HPP05_26805 [Corallococcus exiguus]|uniref:hypothetical protein n=1 Tax=Corallococcus TaxID=83461 RepID=UPI0013155E93|nr:MULTISPECIES: hypothetical protein [Corallococcus]NPC73365.1 hypothetical protein [Corallococcus exiguus]